MTTQDVLRELAVILGGTASAVAALAWLARGIVTHFLSKDVEGYKARLLAENSREIERLRSDLNMQVLAFEVKFRRIDEKVAATLDGIYRRLQRFYAAVGSYVQVVESSADGTKKEKLERVQKANDRFWAYFIGNRVYVPPTLYAEIRKVGDSLTEIANDMTSALRREERGIGDDSGMKGWSAAYHKMENEVSKLFSKLVSKVQQRLGIQD